MEIADELHLSAKTVSTHKARLMKKLGVDNLSDLVRYAMNRELT
jgi:DNA-binding NarL/FixJ family response regulator